MNVYIYQAALLCQRCGEHRRALLQNTDKMPANPAAEYTYDSDDYPKGPYANGGGAADTPQHCDDCSVYLNNPLTTDGVQYVLETLLDGIGANAAGPAAVLWSEHLRDYPLSRYERFVLDEFRRRFSLSVS